MIDLGLRDICQSLFKLLMRIDNPCEPLLDLVLEVHIRGHVFLVFPIRQLPLEIILELIFLPFLVTAEGRERIVFGGLLIRGKLLNHNELRLRLIIPELDSLGLLVRDGET